VSNPVRIAYLGTFLAFASMQPAPACDADARDFHDASSVLSQSSARPDGSRSVGDLVTEVDGVPVESIGQAEFGDLMRRPDGTVVQFSVVRDGSPRPIALTLTELLP